MNPYVFVVGCPRSGTTLLRRLLDAHERVAIVHETRWIARTWEERLGLTEEGVVTEAFIERLAQPDGLRPFGFTPDELWALYRENAGASLPFVVTALFDTYGARQAKSLVGDKSPGYVRYIPTLAELWPDARFVHIARDGRDVWLSVRDWGKGATTFDTFESDPVTTTAVWWEWYVRLGREGGDRIGRDRYHEVRYEALVADPAAQCVELCRFLNVPFEPAMLRYHEGRMNPKPGLSTKSQWLPVTAGLRSWRSEMDPVDVLRFEAAAGDLLEELGYPLSSASVPRRAHEHADAIRRRFARQAEKRRRPLPRAWGALVG